MLKTTNETNYPIFVPEILNTLKSASIKSLRYNRNFPRSSISNVHFEATIYKSNYNIFEIHVKYFK